jgi:hypothetical protein
MSYKIYKIKDEIIAVVYLDNSFIPLDKANTDYKAYLAWVAEGNTAEEWTGN